MAWNESACVPQPSGATGDNRAWTEERVALLIHLREEKLSRAEIAERINKETGSAFSKSAICGKIDRIFLAARPIKTEEEKAATRQKQLDRDRLKKREARLKANPHIDMNRRRAAIGRVDPGLAVVAFKPEDFTDANVHGLENLEPHHCRWIIGDDTRNPTFCGLHILDGSSYCSGHHRIVWVPPQKRRAA
jgi:hypothetical protein